MLALVLLGSTGAGAAMQNGGPPPQGYGQGNGYGPAQGPGGWDAPPGAYSDVQRQGFHDGIDAARRDFHDGRPPNFAQHQEFRQPHLPPPARHDYRNSYRQGYQLAMQHIQNRDAGPR